MTHIAWEELIPLLLLPKVFLDCFVIQQHVHYRQWKALESWSDQMIKDLSYVSRMEEFNHNKVIVKDSKKNEWLWFIIRVSS